METIQVLDAASSAALLGATVSQADGVLYVVGGHDRGPQRPEDSDPWLRVTAIDAKRGDGRYWTPDSENTGLVNRFGHAAFMLRQELYVFGGEATDASRATLGRTDCGAVSGRGLRPSRRPTRARRRSTASSRGPRPRSTPSSPSRGVG